MYEDNQESRGYKLYFATKLLSLQNQTSLSHFIASHLKYKLSFEPKLFKKINHNRQILTLSEAYKNLVLPNLRSSFRRGKFRECVSSSDEPTFSEACSHCDLGDLEA